MKHLSVRTGLAVGVVVFCSLSLGFFYVGCNRNATLTELNEIAQQVGDLMASLDEASGSNTGDFTMLEGANRTFARLGGTEFDEAMGRLTGMTSAHAAECGVSTTFGACTGGVITRDFQNCTINASAVFSGTVELTYSDAACSMANVNDSVTRVPNFTVTGLRGATLTVEKAAPANVGQVITRTGASSFSVGSDGIRRTFAIGSNTLIDFTTETTEDVTLSGTGRADRVIDGGTIRITNNLTNLSCDIAPSAVAWEATCNCATSGSWSGTCSDGKTATLTITECGFATLAVGSSSATIIFDRCFEI